MFDVSHYGGAIVNIEDFSPFRPRIVLSVQAFPGIGPAGEADAALFGVGAVATAPAQRILYDPATGFVRFDEDGSGPDAATAFARLGESAMSHADFVIAA